MKSPASPSRNCNLVKSLKKEQWVASEKVHGANLCFEVDQCFIKAHSRRRCLSECPDETFFGYKLVLAAHESCLRRAFELVSMARDRRQIEKVLIYGELCGGFFPGVQPILMQDGEIVEPVQLEIAYGPSLYYYAFDIAVVWKDDASPRFLDFDEQLRIFKESNFALYAEPLHQGPYETLIALDLEFYSTIPEKIGLHPLNLAEGLVLRPLRAFRSSSGTGTAGDRVIVKKKAPNFQETVNSLSSMKGAGGDGYVGQIVESMVNRARLLAARSKVGPQATRDELANEMFFDCLNDLQEVDQWNQQRNPRSLEQSLKRLRAAIINEISYFYE